MFLQLVILKLKSNREGIVRKNAGITNATGDRIDVVAIEIARGKIEVEMIGIVPNATTITSLGEILAIDALQNARRTPQVETAGDISAVTIVEAAVAEDTSVVTTVVEIAEAAVAAVTNAVVTAE